MNIWEILDKNDSDYSDLIKKYDPVKSSVIVNFETDPLPEPPQPEEIVGM
jgi:hypothetical protein